MATINDPLLNGMRGRVGKYVFTQLYGKTIVRSLPFSVKNPKTPAQTSQRTKFGTTVDYLRQLKYLLHISWQNTSGKCSQFNEAMSYNSKNALIQTNGEWQLNPPALKHANGSLQNAYDYTITNPDSLKILISWRDNSGISNALPTDTFCYLAYNITQNTVIYDLTNIKRSDQSHSFNLPDDWSGCDVAFYVFFKGQDKYSVSNDSYLGTINLPSV